MPTIEDDTKMLKSKVLQLETTIDKLILPICLMASWLLANLCFIVVTLIGIPAVFHFAFPTTMGMMRLAAETPYDCVLPVAIGSSFPRALEPVGHAKAFRG